MRVGGGNCSYNCLLRQVGSHYSPWRKELVSPQHLPCSCSQRGRSIKTIAGIAQPERRNCGVPQTAYRGGVPYQDECRSDLVWAEAGSIAMHPESLLSSCRTAVVLQFRSMSFREHGVFPSSESPHIPLGIILGRFTLLSMARGEGGIPLP